MIKRDTVKLRKSVRTLRRLEAKVDHRQSRSARYRDALSYRREIYREYGALAVMREIERQKHG